MELGDKPLLQPQQQLFRLFEVYAPLNFFSFWKSGPGAASFTSDGDLAFCIP